MKHVAPMQEYFTKEILLYTQTEYSYEHLLCSLAFFQGQIFWASLICTTSRIEW